MNLGESLEIGGFDIDNAPLVDHAWCDQSILDEFAQPIGGERVPLQIIGGAHKRPHSIAKAIWPARSIIFRRLDDALPFRLSV